MTPLRIGATYTPTPEDPPAQRLGGPTGIARLVNTFYDVMEATEPQLTALHNQMPDGKISATVRHHFTLFLTYWLGGPEDYLAVRGHPRLRMRHAGFTVDENMRDAWLRSMTAAIDAHGVDDAVRTYLLGRFSQVADFLRNTEATAPRDTSHTVG
jgi:hemoglobin